MEAKPPSISHKRVLLHLKDYELIIEDVTSTKEPCIFFFLNTKASFHQTTGFVHCDWNETGSKQTGSESKPYLFYGDLRRAERVSVEEAASFPSFIVDTEVRL